MPSDARFRKRPVVVEAFQVTETRRNNNAEWPHWLNEAWNKNEDEPGAFFRVPKNDGTEHLLIHSLEGAHIVTYGDWIIRGVKGELYACKPDVFALTYEPAEREAAAPAVERSTTPSEMWKLPTVTNCEGCGDVRSCTWIESRQRRLCMDCEKPAAEPQAGVCACPGCSGHESGSCKLCPCAKLPPAVGADPLTVACPECNAKPTQWCCIAGAPRLMSTLRDKPHHRRIQAARRTT